MRRQHKWLISVLVAGGLAALSLIVATASYAGSGTFVPFVNGFAGPLNKGLPLPGGGVYLSSPTLADLNHDGKLEILIGSGRDLDGVYRGNGYLHAIRYDGTVLWSVRPRPAAELGPGDLQPPINASPAVIHDIDGDGWDDVVVGLGGEATTSADNWDGGVAAYSGKDGSRLWVFNSADWNGHVLDGHADGVFSSPAVGDVNGNGDEEIAFGSWDQCVYLLDSRDGKPLWTNYILPDQNPCKGNHGYYNEDTVWSSPAMADLDNDGKLEIVIGADVTSGNVYGDPAGGYLYVFSSTGATLGRFWINQAIYSSPAIGDLDNDGALEIAVGTGLLFSNKGYYVKAFEYTPDEVVTKTLKPKWTGATAGQVFGSPALADLNKDGILDVVAVSFNADANSCGVAGARVYAWRGSDGTLLPGFPAAPLTMDGSNNQCMSPSPIIADIDNDGWPEILFAYGWEVTILNHDGTQYTDSDPFGTKPTFQGYGPIAGAPAVGDIDQDGTLEVIAGGVYDATDYPDGTRWKTGALKAWQTSASASNARPWPMFHRNAQHTGLYRAPRLSTSPNSILVLHQVGQSNPEETQFLIQNVGGDSFNWTSTVPAEVALSPSGGTVATTMLVTVTVTTAGQPVGTHPLGDISISATSSGSSVSGSPATIPVTLHVANFVFLPLITKQ